MKFSLRKFYPDFLWMFINSWGLTNLGIPKIHDLILENDSLILIEDYIHGQTLEQLLEEQTTLVYSDALAIMHKLCDVLKSLHTLTPPIIHRDLKLSNIILTSENLVYIVDFDTARYYESGQEQDTELLGTKEYALQNSMDLGSLMPDLIFMHWGLFLTAYWQENIQNINWQMTDIVPSFQNVFDGILRNVSRRLRNLRQLYTIIFPLILEKLDLRFLRYILIFQDFVLESCGKWSWHSSGISLFFTVVWLQISQMPKTDFL